MVCMIGDFLAHAHTISKSCQLPDPLDHTETCLKMVPLPIPNTRGVQETICRYCSGGLNKHRDVDHADVWATTILLSWLIAPLKHDRGS